MAKLDETLNINGTDYEVCAKAENVSYGQSNVKAALDTLTAGGGGQGQQTTWQSMWVLGDSTASDGMQHSSGYALRYTTVSVYKALARMVGLSASAYHNLAVNGASLGGVLNNQMVNVGTDADIIFIQAGVNYSTSEAVGDIDTILGYDLTSAALDDTMLGKYYHIMLYLRDKCPNARIVCVSPLYATSREGEKLTTFRNGVKLMCEYLGGESAGYYHISGLALGIDSSNAAALFDDGVLHPNKQGAIVVAGFIRNALSALSPSVFPDSPYLETDPKTLSFSVSAGGSSTLTLKYKALWWGDASFAFVDNPGNNNKGYFSVSPASESADEYGNVFSEVDVTFNASGLSAGEYPVMLWIYGSDNNQEYGHVNISAVVS